MTTIRTLKGLADKGLVQHTPALDDVAASYAIAVTPEMSALMTGAPDDPIGRQFLPSEAELNQLAFERPDPIGDAAHSPLEGIVHRYPDRVLLKLLHVCPVYCRFCFRRESVGPGANAHLSPAKTEAALAYIANNPAIWEVILTGGDPLMLSPRRLGAILERLGAIAHVKVIRLHTRVPAVDPGRLTVPMVRALRVKGAATYIALHANHPAELTPAARLACASIIDAGVPMLSQSVLLKGVNDNIETLTALMRAFVEMRIKPYYLHHPDLAPGTSHFRLSIAQGQALMQALRGRVSGLCQPTYMLDIPGGFGKVALTPNSLGIDDGQQVVLAPDGQPHIYAPEG
ncbi:MAG: lysine-2,3-aminomutase-like protein [Hyphomicrobiales bacterium]|nr:lysine-2,3-aminomutase-like protein [Hyphomicrobiales bacterium]MDE2115563.1 lysine-2,3-aminomutase-like protein [Hyphomicrobiales bacterium]